MPKVTMEFNLPEDDNRYELAHNAYKYWNTLWELDQECRSILKYSDEDLTDAEIKVYEWVREQIHSSVDIYTVD